MWVSGGALSLSWKVVAFSEEVCAPPGGQKNLFSFSSACHHPNNLDPVYSLPRVTDSTHIDPIGLLFLCFLCVFPFCLVLDKMKARPAQVLRDGGHPER